MRNVPGSLQPQQDPACCRCTFAAIGAGRWRAQQDSNLQPKDYETQKRKAARPGLLCKFLSALKGYVDGGAYPAGYLSSLNATM